MAKRKRVPKQPKTKLDIIIPVYGQHELLEKCLASIKASASYQLIAVDDCSPENELDQIEKLYNEVGIIPLRNYENQGFAKTVNTGVNKGKSEMILILNSDIELLPDTIDQMIAEFDNPEVGIVGPKLLFPLDSIDPQRPAGKVQHAGLSVDFQGQIRHNNISWDAGHPTVNSRQIVQAVTGACLMTRRSVFKEVHKQYRVNGDNTSGAFNEVYGRGTYEDIEYCFAARALGYQVIYQPKAVGYHYVGASIRDEGYPVQRNEMIFRARVGQMLAWDEFRFL